MDQRQIGWIGGIAGIVIGILGAVFGAVIGITYGSGQQEPMSPAAISFLAWGGALLGAAGGVLGGVLGTCASLKGTRGPRERAFVLRASVLCWVLVFAFLMGMLLLPGLYKHLLWIPYVFLLIFGIRWWNQVQFRIRREESGDQV